MVRSSLKFDLHLSSSICNINMDKNTRRNTWRKKKITDRKMHKDWDGLFVLLIVRSITHSVLVPQAHMQSRQSVKRWSGTHKGLLGAATADANGARLLQQIEVFFLELEPLWELPFSHLLRFFSKINDFETPVWHPATQNGTPNRIFYPKCRKFWLSSCSGCGSGAAFRVARCTSAPRSALGLPFAILDWFLSI